jgi:hypothetical protein
MKQVQNMAVLCEEHVKASDTPRGVVLWNDWQRSMYASPFQYNIRGILDGFPRSPYPLCHHAVFAVLSV